MPGGTPGAGAGNHPPVLVVPEELHAVVDDRLVLDLRATDTDLPWQTLAFSADQPLPDGAAFEAHRARFTWIPGAVQAPGSYPVTFRVSDGAPGVAGEDRRTVTIHVHAVTAPTVLFGWGVPASPGTIAWNAVPG